jgi:hypothetical protein
MNAGHGTNNPAVVMLVPAAPVGRILISSRPKMHDSPGLAQFIGSIS